MDSILTGRIDLVWAVWKVIKDGMVKHDKIGRPIKGERQDMWLEAGYYKTKAEAEARRLVLAANNTDPNATFVIQECMLL